MAISSLACLCDLPHCSTQVELTGNQRSDQDRRLGSLPETLLDSRECNAPGSTCYAQQSLYVMQINNVVGHLSGAEVTNVEIYEATRPCLEDLPCGIYEWMDCTL